MRGAKSAARAALRLAGTARASTSASVTLDFLLCECCRIQSFSKNNINNPAQFVVFFYGLGVLFFLSLTV